MTIELRDMQPKLIATQAEVAAMLEQILIDKKDADETRVQVEAQQAEAATTAAECKRIRDTADSQLKEALPMLDKALECLNDLKKSDIEEVKNFKKPTDGVKLTMEAACIMLGVKVWRAAGSSGVGVGVGLGRIGKCGQSFAIQHAASFLR